MGDALEALNLLAFRDSGYANTLNAYATHKAGHFTRVRAENLFWSLELPPSVWRAWKRPAAARAMRELQRAQDAGEREMWEPYALSL